MGTAVRRSEPGNWATGEALRAILPQVPRQVSAHVSAHSSLYRSPLAPASECPEVDCIRHLLPGRIVAAAERRAKSIGVGAERVLICADAITEEAYLAALSASLGTSYERLDSVSRGDCPLDDSRLIEAAAAGLLPLRHERGLVWIVAPRGLMARRLADPHQARPAWLKSFRLTSEDRLRQFVTRHTQRMLGKRAAEALHLSRPLFSNAPRRSGSRGVAAIVFAMFVLAFIALAPLPAIEGLSGLCCALFLAAALLRLLSACFTATAAPRPIAGDDTKLPVYTVICALYRETATVADLVAAIRALDYPREKLDVKFVLEADDRDTRGALDRLNLGPPFEIIIAPPVGPRTKPKALNAALPFARGAYTVVYDAEDVPEPDQLRRALETFRQGGTRLACVQASLTIDNTDDNWLARMFTANYAGQFDVFLRGLAVLQLPFPLGGSSNHFRTAVLRKAGGWDPYNVTEDADLGIRLYRLGYRAAVISSTTYEEAPARLVPWLKQRTRWYKGWMQTWIVHMRRPQRLLRELTPAGAIALQIFFAANVLAALIHPLFMAGLAYTLYALPAPWANTVMATAAPIFATSLISGYASTIVLDVIGLRRRGLLGQAWVLVLTPLHWLLLSLAAWRAIFQLLYDPQRWEKTEHGLAKTSRAARLRRSRPQPPEPVGEARRKSLDARRQASDIGPDIGPSRTPPFGKLGPAAPIAPMKLMQAARGGMLG
jgi:cellulose synthase/poly-beta-1,6-N-acetylglucosamine synthase-like glycosyltransferase